MTPSLVNPNSDFVCAGRLHGRGDCKGDGTCRGGGERGGEKGDEEGRMRYICYFFVVIFDIFVDERGGEKGHEEGRMRGVDQELKQNFKLVF